ncbi:hypothetical protein FAF44_25230 [Nonomuraea sp. MG754425]|uniref:hypothetical protein n=1 Tax=Nonomuraea sp. MG754425 TaxID=2570319 RepID=UPI001F2326F1|nr:hypothetical protein [Nonomuraea sp. MG754425]MCF6471673.1 hypothetical protein [Nonomuraea sp. MG754425]
MNDGYSVTPEALRRRAAVYRDLKSNAEQARDSLRDAFDRDRKTLGNDAYGAEMAKQLPAIERRIFDDLESYLDELDGLDSGLHATSRNYEWAEDPPGSTPRRS